MSQTNTIPPGPETGADDSEILRGLPSRRWTVVDRFDRDGKRYILACREDRPVEGLARLTAREREALAYASRGYANKLIAYEMALSASTVGVLLFRASKKLGTTTRRELVALYTSQPAAT